MTGYASAPARPLTPRMLDVLQLRAAGRTVAETAVELGVAESTVRSISAALYDRLGVHAIAPAYIAARGRGEV